MSEHEPHAPESSRSQEAQPSVTQSHDSAASHFSSLTATIRLLRSTAQILDKTAQTIEAQPADSTVGKGFDFIDRLWQRLVLLWQKLLITLRTRLPENLTANLSDRSLGGVVAGVAIVLLWFTSNLFSSKPPQPTQIASRPPARVAPAKRTPKREPVTIPTQPTESFPSELSAPESIPSPAPVIPVTPPVSEPRLAETPVAISAKGANSEGIAAPKVAPSSEPVAVSEARKVEETATPSPEELASAAKPSASPTPEAVVSEPVALKDLPSEPPLEPVAPPIPKIELTPEQKRIASIQDQLSSVSDRYMQNLVDTVQPNDSSRRLTVKVADYWYELDAEAQDEIANAWLTRSQTLDFSKLIITDTKGALIARSPVVGSSMVVLKRKSQIA